MSVADVFKAVELLTAGAHDVKASGKKELRKADHADRVHQRHPRATP